MKTITVYEFDELEKRVQKRIFKDEYSLAIRTLGWESIHLYPDELRGCSTKSEFNERAKKWATREANKIVRRHLYLKDGKEFEKK